MGADSGHQYCTCSRQGEVPPPDDLGRKISWPSAIERARIGPANTTIATTLGRRIFVFSGHFRPTHTSLPPLLDPLNSFSLSLFANSLPFERYNENKIGRLLDRVFRPPQQMLDQGNGNDVFLVSWAFH